MSDLVKFSAMHLQALVKEPGNKHLAEWLTNGLAKDLESRDSSFTLLIEGKIMVCGGITKYWEGRGQVWSVFSEMSKYNFTPVYRGMKTWLKDMLDNHFVRIEMSVACDLATAKRRAELLGFEVEVERARKYLPTGEDCTLYAMVRL